MSEKRLERRVYFYRVYIGGDARGKPHPFNAPSILATIEELGFDRQAPPTRYEIAWDGDLLCAIPTPQLSRDTIRFCRIRFTGLPQLERGGTITDLQIDEDTGLIETTHAVFFDDNVVGIEYNHHGPRPSQLASYLCAKSNGNLETVELQPLLRKSVLSEFDRLTDLRLLDLRVHRSYAAAVKAAHSSFDGYVDATNVALEQPEVIPISLQFERGTGRRNLARFGSGLRTLVQSPGLHENMDRFRLRGKCGDTGRVETIDLLGDRLVSLKRMMRLNDRGLAISSDSAFSAIREAHSELREEIEFAASALASE